MSTFAVVVCMCALLRVIQSVPCIPTDTCFTSKAGATSALDTSWSATCSASSPRVTKSVYQGSTSCSGNAITSTINENGKTGAYSGTLLLGVEVGGSSSGAVPVDYLQGTNCPNLGSSADSCSEYVVFRRYGNSGYTSGTESLPYQDIGTDCANKGAKYDEFVAPKGCFRIDAAGSNEFGCNSTHLWWNHWTNTDCTGTLETAQSDIFKYGECGYFIEYTHCNNGLTICPGDDTAVIDEWYYYFEVDCGCTDTCTPGSSGSSSSPSPSSSPVATPAPTTANPTDVNGTGKPTTPNPTVSITAVTSASNRIRCALQIVLIVLAMWIM